MKFNATSITLEVTNVTLDCSSHGLTEALINSCPCRVGHLEMETREPEREVAELKLLRLGVARVNEMRNKYIRRTAQVE